MNVKTSQPLISLQGNVVFSTPASTSNKQRCLMTGKAISARLSLKVWWRCCWVYSPPCTFCSAVGRFKALLFNYTYCGGCRESALVTHYCLIPQDSSLSSWYFAPQVQLVVRLRGADILFACCLFSMESYANEGAWGNLDEPSSFVAKIRLDDSAVVSNKRLQSWWALVVCFWYIGSVCVCLFFLSSLRFAVLLEVVSIKTADSQEST